MVFVISLWSRYCAWYGSWLLVVPVGTSVAYCGGLWSEPDELAGGRAEFLGGTTVSSGSCAGGGFRFMWLTLQVVFAALVLAGYDGAGCGMWSGLDTFGLAVRRAEGTWSLWYGGNDLRVACVAVATPHRHGH